MENTKKKSYLFWKGKLFLLDGEGGLIPLKIILEYEKVHIPGCHRLAFSTPYKGGGGLDNCLINSSRKNRKKYLVFIGWLGLLILEGLIHHAVFHLDTIGMHGWGGVHIVYQYFQFIEEKKLSLVYESCL